MKYIQLFTSVIALVVSLFVGYKFVNYQPQGAFHTKAAILDSDEVINKSLALQSVQQQIKERNSALQQEFDLLSEAAKEEKTEQFNKRAVKARDDYAKKMSDLEESYRDAVDSIFNKIKEVAKKTAEKNEINLVLFVSKKNQVLYSTGEVDLSGMVLNNINKEIPEFAIRVAK